MAVVARLMKAALPDHASVGKDAKTMISRASGLFVLYITNRASEIAQENRRQTINTDDIKEALRNLNFEDFIAGVEESVAAFQEEEEKKNSKTQRRRKEREDRKEEEEEEDDDEEA